MKIYRTAPLESFLKFTWYMKAKLKNYLDYKKGCRENKDLYIRKNTKKRFFVISCPDYGNLGDHAIAYAENIFIHNLFDDIEAVEITTKDLYKNIGTLKRNISEEDIIILSGGGNLGDEYLPEEVARRRIISDFPDNEIIIFPQTIYFSCSAFGKSQLNITKEIYSSHKHLNIIAREKVSYNLMKNLFRNNNVILTPDIVMYLDKTDCNAKRAGALLCLREDKESYLSEMDKYYTKVFLQSKYSYISETDTTTNYPITIENREAELNIKWQQFCRSQLVITDRLHGMIFAAITSTPCIALGNYNHKVKGTYEWLRHLNYIKFADSIGDIPKYLEELEETEVQRYEKSVFEVHFRQISDLIYRRHKVLEEEEYFEKGIDCYR